MYFLDLNKNQNSKISISKKLKITKKIVCLNDFQKYFKSKRCEWFKLTSSTSKFFKTNITYYVLTSEIFETQ